VVAVGPAHHDGVEVPPRRGRLVAPLFRATTWRNSSVSTRRLSENCHFERQREISLAVTPRLFEISLFATLRSK
jgi:hypothetical protein